MDEFAVDKVTGELIKVPSKSSYTIDLIESARAAVIKAAAESNGLTPQEMLAVKKEQAVKQMRQMVLTDDEEISKLNRRYLEKLRHDALMNKAGKRRSWTAEEIRQGLAVQDEGKTWDADTEDIIYHERSKTYRVVPRYPIGVQDAGKYQYDDEEEVVEAFVVDQVKEPIFVKPKGPTKMDPFWIQRGGERIDKTHTGEPIPEELELWYNGDLSVWRWDTDRALDIEPLVLANIEVEKKNIEEGYRIREAQALEEVQTEIVESRQLDQKITTGVMLASGVGTAGVALATQNFMMMPVALALLSGPSLIRPRK